MYFFGIAAASKVQFWVRHPQGAVHEMNHLGQTVWQGLGRNLAGGKGPVK